MTPDFFKPSVSTLKNAATAVGEACVSLARRATRASPTLAGGFVLAALAYCAWTGQPRLPYSVSLPFEAKPQVVRFALPDPWSILGVSAQYRGKPVLVRQIGEGAASASVFWAGPVDGPRKTVLFFPAAGFSDLTPYQTWIDHLAQRGFAVFVPKLLTAIPSERLIDAPSLHDGVEEAWRLYAHSCGPRQRETAPAKVPSEALGAPAAGQPLAAAGAPDLEEAPVALVRRPNSALPPPCPDASRVAVFGHGEGAILAANWAAEAAADDLPAPNALLLMSPESHWRNGGPFDQMISRADWGKIPESTAFLLTTASNPADLASARAMWSQSQKIPAARRNWVVFHSDAHGSPALVADALSPTSLPHEDNLNYYGYWKLGDALLDDVWKNGFNHDAAFGGGPRQRFMGVWSDGRAVTQPDVLVPYSSVGLAGSAGSTPQSAP